LLREWRIAALPFNRAMALLSSYAGMVATTAINAVSVIRNLPHVTGGLATILALALAAMALRTRHPYPSGRPQPQTSSTSDMTNSTINETRAPVGWRQYLSGNLTQWLAVIPHQASPAARDAPGAIEALGLAHAYVEEVREADTPTREDHLVRNHHLKVLTLASEQLDAAQKRDPDAILEGQNEKGNFYRFSINELKAEALLLEGITYHTYDGKRAIRALRKATTLNPNSSYAFYVLGLMHAASMNKAQAVAALRRAVVLKPQNLAYREELNRAQCLSAGTIAGIFNGGIEVRNIFAVRNIVRFLRRAHLSIYRGTLRLLEFPRFY
jgi:tetratricopeptide (TPR) repeat protein